MTEEQTDLLIKMLEKQNMLLQAMTDVLVEILAPKPDREVPRLRADPEDRILASDYDPH